MNYGYTRNSYTAEPYSIDEVVDTGDDRYHKETGLRYEIVTCEICGLELSSSEGTPFEEEIYHDYDEDGKCNVCDHVCKHSHSDFWYYYEDEDATYRDTGDEERHTVNSTRKKINCCEYCYKELGTETVQGQYEEYHEYGEDGKCVHCGHACAHTRVRTETRTNYDVDPVYTDDAGDAMHTVTYSASQYTMCEICGKRMGDETPVQISYTERHDFNSDGVCMDCGHVNKCAHANKETSSYIAGLTKDAGDKGHTTTGYRFEQVYCLDCGMTISSKLVDRNASETKPHDYVDGLCLACGHIKLPEPTSTSTTTPKPTATPTPTPTATTAPEMELVYEPVSDETPVSGVRAADHPALVEALETVGETLEGDSVTVEIPNIDKVLTADEMKAFNALTVRERLMVALSALGFHDMVEEAAAQNPDLLSDEALKLVNDIAARLSALSEKELSAMAQLLAQVFPKETLFVDGQPYTCFNVDLVIDRDGQKSYERYTFRQDGESWVLAKVKVGVYKPVET